MSGKSLRFQETCRTKVVRFIFVTMVSGCAVEFGGNNFIIWSSIVILLCLFCASHALAIFAKLVVVMNPLKLPPSRRVPGDFSKDILWLRCNGHLRFYTPNFFMRKCVWPLRNKFDDVFMECDVNSNRNYYRWDNYYNPHEMLNWYYRYLSIKSYSFSEFLRNESMQIS